MCEHKRLRFFKQHYRCRDCQEWWPYPHLLAARHPDQRVMMKLVDRVEIPPMRLDKQ